ETSDSFQIMRLYQEGWPFDPQLIPAENIGEIHKIEPTQVAQSSGWLHFRNPGGTELSCRVLVDKFPDTGSHFEVSGQEVVFPKQMTEILDRVMVFTKADHFMDEQMEVKLKGGKMLVSGKNQYGWFKEQAPV